LHQKKQKENKSKQPETTSATSAVAPKVKAPVPAPVKTTRTGSGVFNSLSGASSPVVAKKTETPTPPTPEPVLLPNGERPKSVAEMWIAKSVAMSGVAPKAASMYTQTVSSPTVSRRVRFSCVSCFIYFCCRHDGSPRTDCR